MGRELVQYSLAKYLLGIIAAVSNSIGCILHAAS